MRLVIISGLSGSGKSVALNTLEDTGFYCIDNLPAAMLESLGHHLASLERNAEARFAVGIDARNHPEDLARFQEILAGLMALGIRCEILFLDAEHDSLLKRFSETRRRHPLSNSNRPLADAITHERQLLLPLLGRADITIDTTQTSLHELRELVRERMVREPYTLSLLLESFGYKHGMPHDADFVFDARCLPNPHWHPDLRPLTGQDESVAEYLAEHSEVGKYLGDLGHFMENWIPRFERENRSYLTVAIGCTGGQHRSVYLVDRLAERLRDSYPTTAVRHRELR